MGGHGAKLALRGDCHLPWALSAEPGSGQGVQFLRDGDLREMLDPRPSLCWMREVPLWGTAGSCVMGTGHGQQCP